MNTIIVLGADRVGKSTLIRQTESLIDRSGCCSYRTLHFSEVKPYHNSPTEQFFSGLDYVVRGGKPDLLLCDRFSPDTIFYEEHRHQTGAHDVELSRMVESAYLRKSEKTWVVFLCLPWSSKLALRHEEELAQFGGSPWWVRRMLQVREREHRNYLSFMFNYLDNQTLINKANIIKLDNNKNDTLFDIVPILESPSSH